ncbi:MAG TPA: GNAT family N-acetyltransferase [Acidimicrobiales bacterium]|nr:GNAT family N-acetyltransferase [Acidimicrobiales bacterium]
MAATTVGMVDAVLIRQARLDDAEGIRAIYNLEVTTSTVTFDLVPRSPAEQRAWLSDRSGAHAVVVATEEGPAGDVEVVGFGALSPYKERPAYATTVESSVYVRRDRHRRGVGDAVVAELMTTATAHGFHAVMARIVGDHEASIALHRRHGFQVVGTEREVGRKFGQWLDVVVLQRLLG